ncbi:hypothetical protein PBRA_008318 [Plasmodiophora brassicae]|uniref:ATP-dependent DNA helicase n=1 Tax=Plasmodiophora brassicae TaxID=37360 RepID=A0A0G4J115_PLABS|nr:hypothetical protein PBRA_008318 [Plasmodiophora brassicae]
MAAADVVDLTADDDDRGHGRDDDGDSDDGIRRRIRVLQAEIDQRRTVIRTLQRVLDERAEARLAVERDAVQRRFMSDGADGKRYPWTDELERARKDKFHLGHWRPMQKEICDAFLSGHDCLVFLPAGSGKSLCFQLPSVIGNQGVTLVISPLVALMHDQVSQMVELDIAAARISADTDSDTRSAIYARIRDGSLALLYISPEFLIKSKRMQTAISKASHSNRIARIAIDEAHCCSQWGHDYRPDYAKLRILRSLCPSCPIMALTATCDNETAKDVTRILGLRPNTLVFRQSVDRPNLFYEVRPKPPSMQEFTSEVAQLILTDSRFASQSGIIYVLSQKETEQLCEQLQKAGVTCAPYHANIDESFKRRAFSKWKRNEIQIVVATVAFGMGVSKPDVRFVIHYALSKSLSGYYQEAGRAGRDRLPAWCILYFSPSDVLRVAALTCDGHAGERNLIEMLNYCVNMRTCRHALIERHFQEQQLPDRCDNYCDNCQRDQSLLEKRDVTRVVAALLQYLRSSGARLTILQLADGWRGVGPVENRVPGDAALDAKAFSRADTMRVIVWLVARSYLQLDYTVTKYTTQAYVTCRKSGVRQFNPAQPFVVSFLPTPKRQRTPSDPVDAEPGTVPQSNLPAPPNPRQGPARKRKPAQRSSASSSSSKRAVRRQSGSRSSSSDLEPDSDFE